ncbi:MAG: hypothetical protein JXM69_12210 [Anaerolineae bacterium]|nr:hypothetical protein [Anaerolineae bacterium]
MFFIAVSFVAYRWVREPVKRNRARQALELLGYTETEGLAGEEVAESEQLVDPQKSAVVNEYRLRHYIWPVFLACLLTFIVYAIAHPYAIQFGLWSGVLEEVIDIFGMDDVFPRRILAGRILFWGFIGAYTYSVHLIFRRFLSYDLTPSIYIFVANRLWLAMTVGAIVGVAVGTLNNAAGMSFDVNLALVSVILFVIGFFPDHGLTWLVSTAQTILKQRWNPSKELNLSEVEGLNIWQQARLKQEGIENVQNLAAANVADLVVSTPFTVNQIIDWIDQAILTVYASQNQLESLEKVGVRAASDLLTNTHEGRYLAELAEAAALNKSELKVLKRSLESALNMTLVARFRWQSSLDEEKIEEAKNIVPVQTQTVIRDQLFGRP